MILATAVLLVVYVISSRLVFGTCDYVTAELNAVSNEELHRLEARYMMAERFYAPLLWIAERSPAFDRWIKHRLPGVGDD